MSVLDLDYYKLTMLQFIWKHYADLPVTFRLHSRKQDLADIVDNDSLRQTLTNRFYEFMAGRELAYLESLDMFDRSFLGDLHNLFDEHLPTPCIEPDGSVSVTGNWFETSLWETIVLSEVSERYSRGNVKHPSLITSLSNIKTVAESGALWADFGTRRRYSREWHAQLIEIITTEAWDLGFIGTSNVDLARRNNLTPIGTYAHELEMVLRPYFDSEFDTTRDVLTKWQEMYPWRLRIALTDTYSTPKFLADHGRFLLDNNWRGVRLDSGDPRRMGYEVDRFLYRNQAEWEVVFSDGLGAASIVDIQTLFGGNPHVKPIFGWGTGLTNPDSDLSLVMKAVESRGVATYKLTDDSTKSIS